MRSRTKMGIALTAVITAASLAACTPQTAPAADGKISVAASTNVYGDVASRVGGDLIEVTSIIDDPSQDPHSFEADARVQLALSKADVVIENGGGYDPFIEQLLADAGTDDRQVVTASLLAPGNAEDGFNEHVWFSIPVMQELAASLATTFSSIDPANADRFERNASVLHDELQTLNARAAELNEEFAGAGVAATEPLPGYLLEAMGLVDVTPSDFSEAVEEGSEVSPAALNDMLQLLTFGSVTTLIVNDQTAGPEIRSVLDAAENTGTPVVRIGETLPEGLGYSEWMAATINDIEQAVRSSEHAP